jgi:CheY-like chemotaxis protein
MPRILVAEDEHAIADAVLYALRSEGLEADHVVLGGQALSRLRAGGIDVLVLDVGLPDRSGFDVCRELRGFSDVPVIFLTARDAEIDRVLGLELGADDYVGSRSRRANSSPACARGCGVPAGRAAGRHAASSRSTPTATASATAAYRST